MAQISSCSLMTIGLAKGARGPCPHKFLAYLIIWYC